MKKFIYDGSNGATAQKVLDQLQNLKDSFIRESYLIDTSYTETNIDHTNNNHHGHSLNEVHKVIDGSFLSNGSSISENSKRDAKEIFDLLTECECIFHKKTRETIHFHEIGRKENILRICLICELVNQLEITEFCYTPLNLGHGQIECSHGILNIPAPATELLIKDMNTYTDKKNGELTSPSGAAIIKYFSNKLKGTKEF